MNTTSSEQGWRVKYLKRLFEEDGLRSSDLYLKPETAPWVRAGIRALEEGVELTVKLLEEADKAQNMAFPERR